MTEMIQGSREWHTARCGKVTASRVADVIAKTKSGVSASRATYMGQLIAERLTGVVAESFKSAAMEHGTNSETEARAAYEFYRSLTVTEVGFVDHPKIGDCGASPDGLIGGVGLVEIKAPNTSTHIETLLGGKIPGKYITQMMWQMACTGSEWCDFVSFDPRLPEHMRMFVHRLPRDDNVIADLEREVTAFQAEMADKISALEAAYPEPQQAAA